MPAPPPEVKLLCDEMLDRLGRFLRAAGYDTAIAAPGTPDEALIAHAAAEDRVLVTCDREIAARRNAKRVVVLPENDLDASARALAAALPIDWLRAPFSRCLVDNAPLRAADAGGRSGMPARARALGGPVRACPACGRIYWPGSHVRRMRAKLARWRGLTRGAAPPMLSR